MKLPFVLGAVFAVVSAGWAFAQPVQNTAPAIGDEVRQMCRQAAEKVCPSGLIPNFQVISRCLEDNKNKPPAQCAPMIAAFRQKAQ
jgi:hypothetical protein